jgi:ribosomal protein S18 acetylase RimI-like enzyme
MEVGIELGTESGVESGIEIRRVTSVAEIAAAEYLFDHPIRTEWAERFLAARGHLMLLAYERRLDDGTPVGFVSGIEMVHPDKGTEMCVYELEVAEPHRHRGIGRALTDALLGIARERGCYGMWVGTDVDNEAALATYESSGAVSEGPSTILSWRFRGSTG